MKVETGLVLNLHFTVWKIHINSEFVDVTKLGCVPLENKKNIIETESACISLVNLAKYYYVLNRHCT